MAGTWKTAPSQVTPGSLVTGTVALTVGMLAAARLVPGLELTGPVHLQIAAALVAAAVVGGALLALATLGRAAVERLAADPDRRPGAGASIAMGAIIILGVVVVLPTTVWASLQIAVFTQLPVMFTGAVATTLTTMAIVFSALDVGRRAHTLLPGVHRARTRVDRAGAAAYLIEYAGTIGALWFAVWWFDGARMVPESGPHGIAVAVTAAAMTGLGSVSLGGLYGLGTILQIVLQALKLWGFSWITDLFLETSLQLTGTWTFLTTAVLLALVGWPRRVMLVFTDAP